MIEILARKPVLIVDREFCSEMVGRLGGLAVRHEISKKAEDEAIAASQTAARLAAAFRASAKSHAVDQGWFEDEERRLRESAGELDRARARVNDIANELLLVAARRRKESAEFERDRLATIAHETTLDDEAWEAVTPLAELMAAQQDELLVRKQLTEQERDTAPLRAERDMAALRLKVRYVALATQERATAVEYEAAAETALTNAGDESERAQRNRTEMTAARVRAEEVAGKVVSINADLDMAVERGDIPRADVDLAEALAQRRVVRRTTAEQLAAVRQRRAARPSIRQRLTERRRVLAAERAAREGERKQCVAELRRLEERVDALSVDTRLAELAQLEAGGRIDLWAEAADLRAALTHAAAVSDAAVIDTRVDAADDDRALDSLRNNDFLPTTRDAQRAVDAISAHVVAQPGWDLLRELVDEADRGLLMENPALAALASGVVVADADVEKAREALESVGFHVVAHVPVCGASTMRDALTAVRSGWWSAPHDPALFDPAAADRALTDRELRRADQDLRIAALHQQADADRGLLGDLDALLRDCPAGHLDALRHEIREIDEAIMVIDGEDAELSGQTDELDAADEADTLTEKQLADEIDLLGQRIERLAPLAGRTAELPELRRTIKQLERQADDYEKAAAAATQRASDFNTEERLSRQLADRHSTNADRYQEDDQKTTLVDALGHGEVQDSDQPLSVLASLFAHHDQRWRAAASQSVLAERLNGIQLRVESARSTLRSVSDAGRVRAEALLRTPDGQDQERRAAARQRARERADKAKDTLAEAKSELGQAVREVADRTPKDRLRHAQLDTEPETETAARELAAARAGEATEMSGRVTALTRDAEAAASAAGEAGTSAQVFEQRARRLTDASAPTVVPEGVAPFQGESATAETRAEAALDGLSLAKNEAATARQDVADAVQSVRQVASNSRFADVPDAIRTRFTGDDAVILAERAAGRAEEMRLRCDTITGQLADIGRDQQLVVVEIAALVTEVLADLESAQRHSKLPKTLSGWADKHFLRISFAKPATDHDLRARIDAVVDRIVLEQSKPEGLALVKRCVHEAVAPRGFTVKVLKPNSDLAVEPVDVTNLGKFSGGEKLTVCVALYCTLARLRAVNRGRRTAMGGTLVLDNPLGTASHVALLRLQRDVAAAHGVQLVYTTGVEDLGAVGQFPNVLRLRNAPGALRTRRYVVLEERSGTSVDGITSVRVTHGEAEGS